MSPLELIVTILCTALTSSGLWALLQKKFEKKDAKAQMLMGIGHDLIISRGLEYIHRGWITHDEFENLYDYLYKPYESLGGNGTAKRVMDEVKKLPLRDIPLVELQK